MSVGIGKGDYTNGDALQIEKINSIKAPNECIYMCVCETMVIQTSKSV